MPLLLHLIHPNEPRRNMKQHHVTFNRQGTIMAFSYDQQTIVLLDTNTKQQQTKHKHPRKICYLLYAPDDNLVISDTDGNTTVVNTNFTPIRQCQTKPVHDIAISQHHIAIADSTTTLNVFDKNNNKNTIQSHGEFQCVAYNPQGSILAAGNLVHMVYLYNTTDYTIVDKLPQQQYATSIVFSAQEPLLIIGDVCGTTSLYNTKSKEMIHRFEQREQINRVVFYKPNIVGIATQINYIHGSIYIKSGHIIFYNIQERKKIEEHTYKHWVMELACSSKGHIAYTDDKNNIFIYN